MPRNVETFTGEGASRRHDQLRAVNGLPKRFAPGIIHVIDEPLAQRSAGGRESSGAGGDLAYRCVKRATELVRGDVRAIATAPLNKEALHWRGTTIGPYRAARDLTRQPRLRDGTLHR